jgi:hypothetical protein
MWVRVIVFSVTFNNVSVISWQAVLLVEENGVSRENQQLAILKPSNILQNI